MIRHCIFDSIVAQRSPPAYLQLAATTDVSIRTGERLIVVGELNRIGIIYENSKRGINRAK
jgi:hypothetical protein